MPIVLVVIMTLKKQINTHTQRELKEKKKIDELNHRSLFLPNVCTCTAVLHVNFDFSCLMGYSLTFNQVSKWQNQGQMALGSAPGYFGI